MTKENLTTSMAKLIMAVCLIVGIGAVMGVVGYFRAVPKSKVVVNDNTKKVIEDKTADWKTYRNEEHGYELKYPAELLYIKEYEDSGSVNFRKEENDEQEEIGVYLRRDQLTINGIREKNSVEELVNIKNKVSMSEYPLYTKIENIKVSEIDGLILREKNQKCLAMFLYNDYLFEVGHVNSVNELKRILSTFKFIPKGGNRLDINNIEIGDEVGDFKVEFVDIPGGVVKFSGKTVLEGTIGWIHERYGYTWYFNVSKDYQYKIPKFINNDGLPHFWLIFESKETEIFPSHPVKIEISEYTYTNSLNIWNAWGSATFVREIIQDIMDQEIENN